jgi:hypothetical protein
LLKIGDLEIREGILKSRGFWLKSVIALAGVVVHGVAFAEQKPGPMLISDSKVIERNLKFDGAAQPTAIF